MPTTTIAAVLAAYGFSARANRSLFWGIGSIMWGHCAEVQPLGNDLYEVAISHWLYDDCGELVRDTTDKRVLHGAQALAWIFKEMPSYFWRQK